MKQEELFKARKNYEKYCLEIEKYYKEINDVKKVEQKIKIINDLYSYIKEISLELYNNDENFLKNYKALSHLIIRCEELLPKNYIVNIKPNNTSILSVPNTNSEDILEYIVNQARKFLASTGDLETINYTGKCMPMCIYINDLCKYLNIESRKVTLFVGFTQTPQLCNGLKQHHFNIINIDSHEYLIDCTYAQFFRLNRAILSRIGIVNLSGCLPGIFMTLNESRRKVTDKILKDGFIKLDDKVLKDYLDGFAISYRNGLYYEETNDFSFTTPYTADDYRKFLNKEDNQVNHESKLILDIQRQPLQNPKLKFR